MPTESQVFKLLSESDGSKIWEVEATHVKTTGNKRKYTKEELLRGARSLSFREINLNHDEKRTLPFPQNGTTVAEFIPERKAVNVRFKISDPKINQLIAEKKIQTVSIEQYPYLGEKCDLVACEQKGVIFTGMALLETYRGVSPGDNDAQIKIESVAEDVPISELVVECSCSADSSLEKPSAKKERMSADPNAKPATPAAAQVLMTEEQIKTLISGFGNSFSAGINSIADQFKNANQLQLEKLSEQIGVLKAALIKESKPNPSSTVADEAAAKLRKESIEDPAAWFASVKGNTNRTDYQAWNVNKEAYFQGLSKLVLRTPENGTKKEAITFNAADKPQIFDKTLYVLPGGRMKVPIRQFLNVKQVTAADRYNFYKGDAFDVDDTTSEGTEPTNESNTVTKVQAVPTLLRSVQTIKYTDIEDAPFDMVQWINEAAMLGALNVEAKEVLDTTYNASLSNSFWVRGDTGGSLSGSPGTDDVVGVGGLDIDGIMTALELLETEGYDTTSGNVVLFAHPHAVRQLALNVASDFFTGDNPVTQRDLGVIERRLGVDIVPTNAVTKTSGGSNTNCYRNVMAVKGYALGLVSAADLQIEAQKKVELSAVKVGARHRIKGVIVDEKATVRISSKTT